MKNVAAFLVAILALGFGSCSKRPSIKPENVLTFAILQAGDIYSVANEKDYGVVKVLAVDADVVHLRLYKNRFASRPKSLDLSALTIGTIHDSDGVGVGVGHAPISKATFEHWQPVLMTRTKVTPEEMEGYELWKQQKGGVFGAK